MSKYRKIDPRIWNDQKFRELSDNGKLAFLFGLTHPHMTSIGAMRATIPGLAQELGWPSRRLREVLQEAFRKGMLKADFEACLLWFPNFLTYNRPESPNAVKGWSSALDYLPECPLKVEVMQHVKAFTESLTEAFRDALPKAFGSLPEDFAIQEQEQEQEDIMSGKPDDLDSDILYQEIVEDLNAVTGKNFRWQAGKGNGNGNRKLIKNKWNLGYRLKDFQHVHRVKNIEWSGTNMKRYLRPKTLYGPNFESYLNEELLSDRSDNDRPPQ